MSTSSINAATTSFSFKLFGELLAREPDKNIFISPTGVFLAVAMALNGAAGETRREIAALLGLGARDLEGANRACAELSRALASRDEGSSLAIANSLWARHDITFDRNFLQRNRAFYKAAIEALDFGDPNAAGRINAWVREQTQGKIDKIVEQIPADAVLYLINAIYFKGDWASKFDAQATTDGAFHLAGGGQRQLPMMRQEGEFLYYQERDFQAILLPYAGHKRSMLVLLPRPGLPLGDFLPTFDTRRWASLKYACGPRDGTIVLPRFTLEYEANLNEPLKALGMRAAFDGERADFSAMCDIPNIGIDEVKHKTYLEINEEGTEAAAVTSVRLIVLGAFDDDDEPFRMVVDRPFFCAILDHHSDTILFMGAVVEP
jgi:serpin B